MGLASTCVYGLTFMILEVVPIAIHNIHWKVFILFAVFNACFVPITYFLLPETAGLSLEAIDLVFTDPDTSSVKKAKALRKSGEDMHLREVHLDDVEIISATPGVKGDN